jgi:tRNA-specific 2-thiouridylase
VLEIRPKESQVVVGERHCLEKESCILGGLNWISIAGTTAPLRAHVKIRSRHREAPATLTPLENGTLRVDFDSPQPAVTPGQAAVFYRGEQVLGGGWIERDAMSN